MRRLFNVNNNDRADAGSRRCLKCATFLCTLMLISVVGCGTAEYERRYDETMKELWRLEPFLALHEKPTTIPLTKPDAKQPVAAEMRLPKQFDNTAKYYPPADAGDDPVDLQRMYPPFAPSLPDYRFSYEQFIGKPGAAQGSIYLYVYAGMSRRSPFVSQLESAIRKTYKGLKSSDLKKLWEEEKCPAPDKSDVEWNRLSLQLPEQTFATRLSQEVTKEELDGIVEVFVSRDGDKHLMFILRMPASLEKEIDLGAIAKAFAGTLRWPDHEDDKAN